MATEPEGTAGVAEDWRSQIPDELKQEPFVANATDFSNFVKQAVDAHKSFGSRIPLPKENATEEQIKEYVAKAAPASPDSYKIEWDEGIAWNEQARPKLLGMLHKNGLMDWQAQGVVRDFAQIMKDFEAENSQATDAEKLAMQTELKARFGKGLDEAKSNAQRGINHIGNATGLGKKVAGLFEQYGLNENPDVLEWAGLIHSSISEDSWMQGETRTMLSPQDAKKKAMAMYQLPKEHPFKNSAHPDHRSACAEHERLLEIAAGQ